MNMLWTHFDNLSSMFAQHVRIVILNIVTSFINVATFTENIGFWCRKEIIEQVQFAENIAQKVVNYLKQKSTKIVAKINYFVIRDLQPDSVKTWKDILLR